MESDRKLYEKGRNNITGDRIITKERGRNTYRDKFDDIQWGTIDKPEESMLEPLSDKCRKEK